MSVNLCIDWGNTNIKAAIFENDTLKKNVIIPEQHILEQVTVLLDTYKPEKAIMCSVTEGSDELFALLKARIPAAINLTGHTSVPINNAYATPETLGPDRLAMVTAAYTLYPGKNNLVISAGTCLTYNHIQKTKTFRGGAISPGLMMRLRAMHEFTSKLPEVNLDGDILFLGYDTETCIRSGAVFGMVAEIEGMMAEYQSKYSDFNAILTGGDAPFFADKIKSQIFADPDLLLKGLNIIINYNVSFPR